MTWEKFKESLLERAIPQSMSGYLQALWYDATGDWVKAHHVIQDMDDKTAASIHAYLHRKEGDVGNADYWYRKAGRKKPSISLEQEWESLTKELINEK